MATESEVLADIAAEHTANGRTVDSVTNPASWTAIAGTSPAKEQKLMEHDVDFGATNHDLNYLFVRTVGDADTVKVKGYNELALVTGLEDRNRAKGRTVQATVKPASWTAVPDFSPAQEEKLVILSVVYPNGNIRQLNYNLRRSVADVNSVKLDGAFLDTEGVNARRELFSELMEQYILDHYVKGGEAKKNRGMRRISSSLPAGGWYEEMAHPTATDNKVPTDTFFVYCYLAGDNLVVTNRVDRATMVTNYPHILDLRLG